MLRKPILLLCLSLVCAGLFAQQARMAPMLFGKQIRESCIPGMRLQKSVNNLRDSTQGAETKLFEVDCEKLSFTEVESGEAYDVNLGVEFSYVFKHFFGNPYIEEYFDIVEQGKGHFLATRKEGSRKKTPLASQEVQFSEDGKVLRKVRSRLLESNWLYDLDIEIAVYFDKSGRYERHQIHVYTHTLGSGKMETEIKGKLILPAS